MTEAQLKVVIRGLANEALAAALEAGIVETLGSVCEGDKYRNSAEHSELPYPHICIYKIQPLPASNQTITYELGLGFFAEYDIENTNARTYSDIQDQMEALVIQFQKTLASYTNENGAALHWELKRIGEENRYNINIGTGKSVFIDIKGERVPLC